MFKFYLVLLTLVALAWCEEDFKYVRNDGKMVMYTVSNVAMPWIESFKVSQS